MSNRIEVAFKPKVFDPLGAGVKKDIEDFLKLKVDSIKTRKVYTINADLDEEELGLIRKEIFIDPIIQDCSTSKFDWLIEVGFKPGVTDNVGRTSKETIENVLERELNGDVYTSMQYLLTGNLSFEEVKRIGTELLANEVIEDLHIFNYDESIKGVDIPLPIVKGKKEIEVKEINLNISDEELVKKSEEGLWSLNLDEMKAIQEYFSRPEVIEKRKKCYLFGPTGEEMETGGQTWSEHCKHRIFNAVIDYYENGEKETIDSLFNTYIKQATLDCNKEWLVSVFKDNAGIIKFNDHLNLVYKVETHNSPSALDPYGGAITGIVGVNRDPLGAGKGAKLIANVWGYCFASPFYDKEVPTGLLHPRRIRNGVHKGVIDGGNQSGIPYAVGWEFFDEHYLGKPLVYCGTLGVMPAEINGKPTHEKKANVGDLIVMIGGRIGKDGIHGATFSSLELSEESPVQAVQIGDPITQKKMSDFLLEARDLNLYESITDNGAGGLSCSVGEMARESGGCALDLAKAPLKYEGLDPWEILVSEAQERMTLAVNPKKIDRFLELAKKRGIEATLLGQFNDSGIFFVRYGNKPVVLLDLDFMHNGLPRMHLAAIWEQKIFEEPEFEEPKDLTDTLKEMLSRLNICSIEEKCRQYDHEVKGLSIIKPFVGKEFDAPSDATVTLAELGSLEGIVLAAGINPSYSDIDTYHMTASIIDEGIRKVIAVGGKLDYTAALDNFCWPDPVQSEKTPDGHYKLAQLVRANKALYDYSVAFGIPLISGKDSMKNDSTKGGKKISIPPTVLYSIVSKMEDVSKAVTMDVKKEKDLVYILGETHDELGGSEYYKLVGEKERNEAYIGNNVPKVDAKKAIKLYEALSNATEEELVHSIHTPTKGGLGVALAKTAFAGCYGMEIDLKKVPSELKRNDNLLFSESNTRFIVTIPEENKERFEELMKGNDYAHVGHVTKEPRLMIEGLDGKYVINANIYDLKTVWKSTLK